MPPSTVLLVSDILLTAVLVQHAGIVLPAVVL